MTLSSIFGKSPIRHTLWDHLFHQYPILFHHWWKFDQFHCHLTYGAELALCINRNGLPRWLGGKESAYQCRRHRFDPWVGKIPWRRKWQPTPVFLPGKSHGQRSLVGYSPWGRKESDTTWRLKNNHHNVVSGLSLPVSWLVIQP
ncbi:unnamed protein product [Rangifer tarandus platyrhynchus]|uniref:Uncharacterized protein n=2 Tax=Rangifer tarandus platyrhynchus TaxID=3082113 RepID=A0AC59Z8T6_RANTA|nr:unnamed protein product [Rangifer tarandus platyrhynchus]